MLKRKRGIVAKKAPSTLKPQQSRKLIRRFHTLNKARASVIKALGTENVENATYKNAYASFVLNKKTGNAPIKIAGDEKSLLRTLGEIDAEITQRGGLEAYQVASTQGQTGARGGDSSKRLVKWLRENYREWCSGDLSALEIGCLDPHNVISTSRIFSSIVRIDLNSQHPLILQQDFMERKLPTSDSEKFHLISCSLVVNFVPSPEGRGAMLARLAEFMRPGGLLFFVLPLPCTENSRYCTKEHFLEIMASLGFVLREYHASVKLTYWLFGYEGGGGGKRFQKRELRRGGGLNNFCVVLSTT